MKFLDISSQVTVRDHLKFVEAMQPNAFECLCDSVPSSGNKLKRIRKSVDRTLRFLDDTLAARASSEVDPERSGDLWKNSFGVQEPSSNYGSTYSLSTRPMFSRPTFVRLIFVLGGGGEKGPSLSL